MWRQKFENTKPNQVTRDCVMQPAWQMGMWFTVPKWHTNIGLVTLDISRYKITRYCTQHSNFWGETSVTLQLTKDHSSQASYGCLSWVTWSLVTTRYRERTVLATCHDLPEIMTNITDEYVQQACMESCQATPSNDNIKKGRIQLIVYFCRKFQERLIMWLSETLRIAAATRAI